MFLLIPVLESEFPAMDMMIRLQKAPSARVDPSRIVEGVIGGIGFLGAGCKNTAG